MASEARRPVRRAPRELRAAFLAAGGVGAEAASSTVGRTPPGVANVTSRPASRNTRIGSISSSAQKPVGWLSPSLSVHSSAPVSTISNFGMALSLWMFIAVGLLRPGRSGAAEQVDDAPLDVDAQRVAVDVGRKLDDHAVVARVDP